MAKRNSIKKTRSNIKVSKNTATQSAVTKPHLWTGLALALLSVLLFANTFGHGFTVDDPLVITKNKIVKKGISAVGEIWSSSYLQGYNGIVDAAYRPMSLTTFAVEKTLFDGREIAMHIMHVLYFALGVFLCYLFSYKLFQRNKVIALVTTIIFLAHPIHTEVVNNLKSRDEVLMLIGLLGTGLFYLKYLDSKNIKSLLGSLAFFFIALFSKESAIAFFLIIPLLYLWENKKWNTEAFRHGGMYLLMSLFYLGVRTSIVGSYGIDMDYMNNALLAEDAGFIGRFPNAVMLMGKYILMLFFPYPLSVDYSFNSIPMSGWSSIWPYLSLTFFIGLIYLAYDGIKKNEIYGILISWFLITIVVASNIFILIGSTFAERFLFVPSFAFCAAIAFYLFKYLGEKALVVGVVIGVVLGGWTFLRNQDWKSDLDLFTRDVQFQEDNARVQTFFGRFTYLAAVEMQGVERTKQLEIAKGAFKQALDIAPDYMIGHYFQGLMAKTLKDNVLATQSFAKVAELDSDFARGRLEYAVALRKEKKFIPAIEQYLWVLENGQPQVADYNNTGYCYFQIKDFQKALDYYLKAYELDPYNKTAIGSIATIYGGALRNPEQAQMFQNKLKALK